MSGPSPLVVVGDALLDRDLAGRVDRISPDAPVPVFAEDGGRDRAGGAALAAGFAAGGSRPVRLVTAVGRGPAGERLRELLDAAGVELVELPYDGTVPEKVRLRAGGQVVLRLDRGERPGSFGPVPDAALAALDDAAAVLVSDYGRGVTGLAAVRAALARVVRRTPVVWDPHPRGAAPVEGLRLVTPNESELRGLDDGARPDGRLPALAAGAERLRRRWSAAAVSVTLGPQGALLAQGGTPLVVPATRRGDGDTCGAGDRFASAAAQALAGGDLVFEAVQAGVARASEFVVSGGLDALARPARSRPGPAGTGPGPAGTGEAGALALAAAVRARGGVVVATGGCFDLLHAGHAATLRAARSLGDCLIVCLNSDASVRELKGPDRPLVPETDRAALVAALSGVDAVVVFAETTPVPLLRRLRPDVWVKGGDYFLDGTDAGPALPEAEVVAEWGGQSVVVPYVSGRSTTGLIHAARTSRTTHEGGSR